MGLRWPWWGATELAVPRVVSINLDEDPSIPSEIDVLFWIQPTRVTREHVVELRRFLDTGRAVILAGSNYFIDTDEDGNHRLRPATIDWNTLLRPVGLPMMRVSTSRAATTSPALAFSTNLPTIAFRSSSPTASSMMLRNAAVRRAKGLPGPPGLPLAKRPCPSRPLSPFGDGCMVSILRYSGHGNI